jgi:undecaprenyl-diphosphatase
MKIRLLARAGALCLALLAATSAQAGGGLLGIDHYVPYDDSGIWARHNQLLLIDAMIVGEVGVALWEGGDSRLGNTLWRSIDATVAGGLASEVMKRVFTRARPNETTNPNQWFQGGGHSSFPSGEVTAISAIVTPVILEYAHDHPSVYALELLPAYDAIARVKVHGHWQSDVIAGFALGSAIGYYMHERKGTPLVLGVLPDGFYVGYSRQFH